MYCNYNKRWHRRRDISIKIETYEIKIKKLHEETNKFGLPEGTSADPDPT
jgi:hypothetical protein